MGRHKNLSLSQILVMYYSWLISLSCRQRCTTVVSNLDAHEAFHFGWDCVETEEQEYGSQQITVNIVLALLGINTNLRMDELKLTENCDFFTWQQAFGVKGCSYLTMASITLHQTHTVCQHSEPFVFLAQLKYGLQNLGKLKMFGRW